ncbi:hypothetical protein [Mitsuaria sp. TWR114]|uniref:hypothetical protein n=1 Tax=Mitsuaria sp. TWR114 TaxID=2601731 RepID=UPI0021026F20|nr:hypothetical protein [Mitsuaria sp. TWR114]
MGVAPGAAGADRPWLLYVKQFALLLGIAAGLKSELILYAGVIHLLLRIKSRDRGWGEFWLGIGLLVLVNALLFRR